MDATTTNNPKTKTPEQWHGYARLLAESAHKTCFSIRRDLWFVEELGALCVFNNNPYADPKKRDEETAAFRAWLAQEGIEELAYATFGGEEEMQGLYTYAMLLRAGEDRKDDIATTMETICGGRMGMTY